ncbi:amino acid ABC transporter permease [Nocardioides marmoriginsengisoli]|uniref:Amino acid ABC transporter permease n=1 Tax=Nocardioides marmoriginsengisoli TaxID=661483 RepID=A0A3N0CJD2_9ACTN|nr:amino acid ABC transporter permease [Nocardioides marmoriginsengisoli]RNL63126.1 amino acid ABC transporter permease [Nocardioides marmoriginsengisoli]
MKRSTKRRLRHGALYALLLGAVAAIALLADWKAIQTNFLDKDVLASIWPEIVTEGARNTVVYTAIAFVGGLVLALALALMKLSPVAPYRWIATAYIEFFRGLPVLIVIIAFAFAVPIAFGSTLPGGSRGAAVIALIAVSAAYMAETLRAGIQAVPKGQIEAARSLGMSETRTLVSVVLPQAVRIVIPPLTNEFVLLLKDTSLIQVAGVGLGESELTNFASDNLNITSNGTPLLAAAILYLIITLPLTRVVAYLERRTQKAR